MNSRIEIDGKWHECKILYPFKEPPLEVPGPLGTSQFQKSSYNAKLVSNLVVHLGNYNIRHNGKQSVFEATRAVSDGVLGEVL